MCARTLTRPAWPSSRWLHLTHPDPEAKNLRQIWLPALEWIYSQRVRDLMYKYGSPARAFDSEGAPLSDAAVLEAADFGVFIDFASTCQIEDDTATDTELVLFSAACVHPPPLCAPAPRPPPHCPTSGSLALCGSQSSLDVIFGNSAMTTATRSDVHNHGCDRGVAALEAWFCQGEGRRRSGR